MKTVKVSSRIVAIAAATLVVAAAVAIIGISIAPLRLVLTDADTGRTYAAFDLADGGEFSITFVHSVNKSPVTEVYVRRGRDIYVTTCIYSTLGAGVATTVEEGQHVERDAQGRWVLSGIDTKIDDLIYFVGTVSDHVLSIGGREISLRDLCGRNAKVRFSVRRSLAATNAGE